MSERRFIPLDVVGETLGISPSQTYALVRSGDLVAVKIGGRGQWRVELSQLDAYIGRMYQETRQFVLEHPFGLDSVDAPVQTAGQGLPLS